MSDTKRGWEEILDDYKDPHSIGLIPETEGEVRRIKDFIRNTVIPQAQAEERERILASIKLKYPDFLTSSGLNIGVQEPTYKRIANETENKIVTFVLSVLTPHKEDNA